MDFLLIKSGTISSAEANKENFTFKKNVLQCQSAFIKN